MPHFSPLLWLCSISAALLNTYAALDPTGVYGDYLAQLDADTPAISALLAAAQDGVYPWTVSAALPGGDSTYGIDPDTEPSPPSGEAQAPENPETPEAPDATPPVEEEPAPVFTQVDESYFDDALFLGDSHTAGFHDYAGLRNATYFTKNGLSVWDATEKRFIELDGEKLTLGEALERRSFGKIYVMLGINEIGSGSTESWAEQYRVLLNMLRETQPDAVIFVQSIFHTTREKSEKSFFKNEVIDERNAALAALADDRTVFYLDVNPVFDDGTGALRADCSGDGVHVRAPYYVEWRDFLMRFGVVKAAEPVGR